MIAFMLAEGLYTFFSQIKLLKSIASQYPYHSDFTAPNLRTLCSKQETARLDVDLLYRLFSLFSMDSPR